MAEARPDSSVVAARGVSILVGRTLGLQLLTAAVTIALARLLSPADYGLFAVAATVQGVVQAATDLGMTASLIRQPDDPTPRQQTAVRSFLVLGGVAFSALAVAIGFGLLPALGLESGAVEVTAVAAIAVPIYAVRAVPMVLLERHLKFGRVAIVETGETLTFNAFALLAAIAGLGAYSLAGAIPAAALVGAMVARSLQSTAGGFAIDLDQIRRLAGFGARVSLFRVLALGRELGFVTLITAIGGPTLAGFYAMAGRLFSFPTALASALQRVTFPVLSRSPRERPPRAARAAILSAMLAGLPLALVAGASHALVSVVLGDRWLPIVDIVLIASPGMLLSSSAGAAMVSLAFAEGRPAAPIASVAGSATAIALASALALTSLGSAWVGVAMLASSLAATAILAAGADRPMRAALVPIGRGLAIGAVAAAAGYLLPAGDDLAGLASRLAVTGAVWLALQALLAREELRGAAGLARATIGVAQVRGQFLDAGERDGPGLGEEDEEGDEVGQRHQGDDRGADPSVGGPGGSGAGAEQGHERHHGGQADSEG